MMSATMSIQCFCSIISLHDDCSTDDGKPGCTSETNLASIHADVIRQQPTGVVSPSVPNIVTLRAVCLSCDLDASVLAHECRVMLRVGDFWGRLHLVY
jgi:hypothetical protein